VHFVERVFREREHAALVSDAYEPLIRFTVGLSKERSGHSCNSVFREQKAVARAEQDRGPRVKKARYILGRRLELVCQKALT
jgi:hypothetical protein